MKSIVRFGSLILVVAGLWQLGGSAWLLAKAELAQYLIANAWDRQLASGTPHKPWPWADTWPVAKLQLAQQKPLMVLSGTSGQALAFGPGLLESSALPNDSVQEARTTVIAAHRDTHFRGLAQLQVGNPVRLQGADGSWHLFRVNHTRVVNSLRESLPVYAERDLVLVTCYPFDAVDAGGPLRYVVHASYEPGAASVQL
ncbi:class GN sortase [Microbulbifer aggregans]|uniref:class GN sortase n=1 Tax=Microbulbifer aggregans TaxID=1769779 RepID=UPI001CFDA801|nr:class GN sortase [Microbulbifer aggregans]